MWGSTKQHCSAVHLARDLISRQRRHKGNSSNFFNSIKEVTEEIYLWVRYLTFCFHHFVCRLLWRAAFFVAAPVPSKWALRAASPHEATIRSIAAAISPKGASEPQRKNEKCLSKSLKPTEKNETINYIVSLSVLWLLKISKVFPALKRPWRFADHWQNSRAGPFECGNWPRAFKKQKPSIPTQIPMQSNRFDAFSTDRSGLSKSEAFGGQCLQQLCTQLPFRSVPLQSEKKILQTRKWHKTHQDHIQKFF